MKHHDFDRWLKAYGAAWEAKEGGAFVALFTDDVEYYWTPFEEPKRGRRGVADAFNSAVANQRDIRFRYEILTVGAERCVARWWCSFLRQATGQPVSLDGILMVKPSDDGLCEVFREWWHSDES